MSEAKKKLKKAATATAAAEEKAEAVAPDTAAETSEAAETAATKPAEENETVVEANAETDGETKTDSKSDDDTDDEEEKDEALSSFLSRQQKEKKPGKLTDFQKKLIITLGVIAAVVVLTLVLVNLRKKPIVSEEDIPLPAEITLSIEDGVHEAEVVLDEDGNIKQNGSGSLLTYVPSNIKKITVENRDGTFEIDSTTPKGEATVYTLVGFEEYDKQSGITDEIATSCAALDFSKVISADGNPADFGLDKPRAKVEVTYNDDTSSILHIGSNAPGGTGAYVSFGTGSAVYLVDVTVVNRFFYSINDLISPEITAAVEDSANIDFSRIEIAGAHYDEPIVLEPNTDEAIGFSYLVTSPRKMFADEVESHDISGNIRGLYGESVVCVNPSADQLASYGLDDPYASVTADYPDTTITLYASAPHDDGTVNVYNPEKKLIFSIQLAAVSWAKTGLDLLTPENPLNVKMAYVDKLSFTAGSTDFTLDITSKTDAYVDDTGTEQTVTSSTASYNGKDMNTDDFHVFFQNVNAIKNLGYSDASAGSKVMSVTFAYTTDRAADTLSVYESDGDYLLEFNGDKVGTVSKKYIEKLITGAENLIKGETVEGL